MWLFLWLYQSFFFYNTFFTGCYVTYFYSFYYSFIYASILNNSSTITFYWFISYSLTPSNGYVVTNSGRFCKIYSKTSAVDYSYYLIKTFGTGSGGSSINYENGFYGYN